MANHGPAYGLSLEVQQKNQAKFKIDEAREVLFWIQNCTGVPFEPDPSNITTDLEAADALKDGVQLCLLANLLLGPGSVKFIKNPKMPFHKMENISKFLEAIKQYGVAEVSCFQTVDLYERKYMYKVIECLRLLASVAQKNRADVPIPEWAVRLSNENQRNFSPDVLNSRNAVFSLQYGSNTGASQRGMTPYGLHRQIM